MGHKKRKSKRQPPVLVNLQCERKKVRSLGYQNAEEYEKGLGVVQRLLAQKNKSDARNPQPVENLARPVEILKAEVTNGR